MLGTLKRYIIVFAVIAVLSTFSSNIHQARAQGLPASAQPNVPTAGQSPLVQDPSWVAKKLAHQINRSGINQVQPALYPTAYQLNTATVATFNEPDGVGVDIAGRSYGDYYMFNLCGPGASSVALSYWTTLATHYGVASFSDPHMTTTWNDAYGRAFIMYLATQIHPPSWRRWGEETYFSYPVATTYVNDLRDALNWQASGHNTSNWANYFYTATWASTLNSNLLRQDIGQTVGVNHVPTIVLVDTAYLSDWAPSKHVAHYVSVVGYNNNNNTFTYAETCDHQCGSYGNGIYTINQDRLLYAMKATSGALIW